MTEQTRQSLLDDAIGWQLRLREGSAADWESFVAWLEADPANAEAYDALARADARLTGEDFPPEAANDDWREDEAPRPRRWGRTLRAAVAIAACLVLAFVALPWLGFGSERYEVATAAGQTMTVPLGDGSMATLNGGTRLILDRHDPRYAELEAGEATFTIRHDNSHPFVVRAGEHRIQDVGTTFNMVHEGERLTVEVIEGAVQYHRSEADILLTAGQTLHVHERGARPTIGRRDPGMIAGWRHGQLSYRGEPLERVGRDLARTLGAEISVDPAFARMPVTGSVRVAGGSAAVLTGFAATLGMEARRDGNHWWIGPPARAPR
jgi:transmembrane sensor